jgi:hypothetical protein
LAYDRETPAPTSAALRQAGKAGDFCLFFVRKLLCHK